MNIDTPINGLREMENSMMLNEDVIRTLSIKVNKLDEEPSIMMKSKDDKDVKDVKLNLSNNSNSDYSNQFSNNFNNGDF